MIYILWNKFDLHIDYEIMKHKFTVIVLHETYVLSTPV